MSRDLCQICGGSGEGNYDVTDLNGAEYLFAGCFACGGSGFKSSRLISKASGKSTKTATRTAVAVILREMDKRRA